MLRDCLCGESCHKGGGKKIKNAEGQQRVDNNREVKLKSQRLTKNLSDNMVE